MEWALLTDTPVQGRRLGDPCLGPESAALSQVTDPAALGCVMHPCREFSEAKEVHGAGCAPEQGHGQAASPSH